MGFLRRAVVPEGELGGWALTGLTYQVRLFSNETAVASQAISEPASVPRQLLDSLHLLALDQHGSTQILQKLFLHPVCVGCGRKPGWGGEYSSPDSAIIITPNCSWQEAHKCLWVLTPTFESSRL